MIIYNHSLIRSNDTNTIKKQIIVILGQINENNQNITSKNGKGNY